jgi:2-amino-4-hydroxy-6-hydroxymethyldihydropteridine diphosphokinase
MPVAYLALGSNLGDRQANLQKAIAALGGHPDISVQQVAPILETAPEGGPEGQGPFLNTAVEVETRLPPRGLLQVGQDVEEYLGREVPERREAWGPRVIDVDLLLYEDEVIDEPGLTVPHMEMYHRGFVLEPLAAIAPEAVHPVLRMTVRELLETFVRGRQA